MDIDGLKYVVDKIHERLEKIELDIDELLRNKSYLNGQAKSIAVVISTVFSIATLFVSYFIKG